MKLNNQTQNAKVVAVGIDLCDAVLMELAGKEIDGNLLENYQEKIAIKARAIIDKKEVIK